jgi:uncharacterized membrane protein YdjX (TVP38/TMEM64 family)
MRARAAVLLVVVSAIAWFYGSGAYESFDPNQLRLWLRDAGGFGGVLFVAAYSFLQPLGVRSIFFLLSAPLVWEPMTAFVLSMTGTVAACVLAFGFARFVGRDWVQRRLPRGIRRLDDRLVTHGFRTVLLLRLVFYTAPTLQYGLGVSRVAPGPFLTGTILGVAPFTALATLIGAEVDAWLRAHPLSSWPWAQFWPAIVLLATALIIGAWWLVRRWHDTLSLNPGES